MTDTLVIDDVAFEVRRSTRRKTVGITVERNSSLVAHLPANLEFSAAERIICDKLVWVHQKIADKRTAIDEDVFRRPEFVDGEGFYYFGRHYRLKLDASKNLVDRRVWRLNAATAMGDADGGSAGVLRY